MTYICHFSHAYVGPWDKFTWSVWSHCAKSPVSCINSWVNPGTKSKMAAVLCDQHMLFHLCTSWTMTWVYLQSLTFLGEVISEPGHRWVTPPSTKSKMVAAPCDLHASLHLWKWRVMREVYLVSLKSLCETLSELLSYPPSKKCRWQPHYMTYICHFTHESREDEPSLPGKFEVAVWSHLQAMATVECGIPPKMAATPCDIHMPLHSVCAGLWPESTW